MLYTLSCNKKERFVALTEAQKTFFKTIKEDDDYRRIFRNNENLRAAAAMIELLVPLNTIINDEPNKDPVINQKKIELAKQGINIVELRDNIVDCVIQLLEAPDVNKNTNEFIAVVVSSSFSTKLNSIFLELNKMDIASLSKAAGMDKDQFCGSLPYPFRAAYSEESSSRDAKELIFVNQVLPAYSNLIMMVYLFIMKNMDSISLYCGEDKTQQYKEFKKLFKTVRTAIITKEDIDSKCPKPIPEKICASYITEASTCNINLASIKTQRTALVVVVIILIIAVIFLAMK